MLLDSVLITGANRGIGLEFVKQLLRLAKPPKHIFAVCRSPENAQVGLSMYVMYCTCISCVLNHLPACIHVGLQRSLHAYRSIAYSIVESPRFELRGALLFGLGLLYKFLSSRSLSYLNQSNS